MRNCRRNARGYRGNRRRSCGEIVSRYALEIGYHFQCTHGSRFSNAAICSIRGAIVEMVCLIAQHLDFVSPEENRSRR